ncbi:site-specific DNA-methyltransferase [Pseudoclavibacter chungangensis]|uniref:Site-specific DNA-methyltransferase n=1 Tax=Pseudoclavibacter chungangensis TaxID=587635 RepID=A0A7J5C3X2_9MICO|nr:site-specific DNA-methyltransferase [Pseudoclavibacter chungangensis]KAB1662480.1 site-specific DNA-methyltransferase [Pseudoclavibacter chungangensis]NYJ68514.1 site-specific DNA-methyltransferase (adenine-specific) [Pseudoclavibacter chungangensis]
MPPAEPPVVDARRTVPLWRAEGPDLVLHGDNLEAMRRLPDGAFQLIYLDPPFNTGKVQRRRSTCVERVDEQVSEEGGTGEGTPPDATVEAGDAAARILVGHGRDELARDERDRHGRDRDGRGTAEPGTVGRDVPDADAAASASAPAVSTPATRTGFAGRSYAHTLGLVSEFNDSFADYWGFLEPRLVEAWRLLAPTGTLYLHLDYRESHYAKVVLDALVGRDRFLNEIVWAYDYGAKTRRRWPSKHETILVYVKDPQRYHFDSAAVDREPYMAPGLVTPEQFERGKLPTDVWWHTIVSPTGGEKTGYATQKPEGILRRIVQASSREGDWIADFFGGSGTTAAVARALGRRVVTVDDSAEALATMRRRLGPEGVEYRKLQREGTRLLSAAPRRASPRRVGATRAAERPTAAVGRPSTSVSDA